MYFPLLPEKKVSSGQVGLARVRKYGKEQGTNSRTIEDSGKASRLQIGIVNSGRHKKAARLCHGANVSNVSTQESVHSRHF